MLRSRLPHGQPAFVGAGRHFVHRFRGAIVDFLGALGVMPIRQAQCPTTISGTHVAGGVLRLRWVPTICMRAPCLVAYAIE
jgi:hypothetical protein